jgi:hypothetical protein
MIRMTRSFILLLRQFYHCLLAHSYKPDALHPLFLKAAANTLAPTLEMMTLVHMSIIVTSFVCNTTQMIRPPMISN